MFLREIHIENVRAVRRASVRFDASTTLIGENNCGKGSVIRALELIMGSGGPGDRLTRDDFHREGPSSTLSGPLRITAVFEERTPGEWDRQHESLLTPLLARAGGRCRRLVLEASATAGEDAHAPELAVHVAGTVDEAHDRAVVAHIRATHPLVRLNGGLLTGHAAASTPRRVRRDAVRPSGPVAALAGRVIRSADALLCGTTSNVDACIDDGARAARDLLARSPRHVDPEGRGLVGSVVELLGGMAPGPAADGHAEGAAAAADRLGTLLLVAAVLRSVPEGLEPGVEPLWVIEDPEVHLHPMTLASAERTLARIRWQKIITTQSGDLLAAVPLAQIRRLVRHDGVVRAAAVRPAALTRDDLRRIGYHLRVHRGSAMFARVWLLVEGESEFWILPQVAQVRGHTLAREGICCVGFAQCGITPLLRTAREFGIEWHLLADGDEAGHRYVDAARSFVRRGDERERFTLLGERDIEHCFWHHGHADTILRVAGLRPDVLPRPTASRAIRKAVERRSKPYLALSLVESVMRRGPASVPGSLAALVDTCVALARRAPERAVKDGCQGLRDDTAR